MDVRMPGFVSGVSSILEFDINECSEIKKTVSFILAFVSAVVKL
jgi:hypothetical protein